MRYLVGVDVGTTSLKAALFNEHGEMLKIHSEDYTLITNGDHIEFQAEQYWDLFQKALEIVSEGYEITAMSIDTQGETLILCDKSGVPLRNAIVWLDNRAKEEARIISEAFGEQRVYEVTGQPEIIPTWPACKLLWIKRHEPEIWKKTDIIMLLEDYLIYKLTGKFATDRTLQSSTIYFDITRCDWWDEMLQFIGVSKSQLPVLHNSGTLIGYSGETAVIAGALDQIAGAIGAGVVKPGIVSEMTGTTMAVCTLVNKQPPYRKNLKIPCHYSAITGNFCLIIWSPTAGMALKWFQKNFCENFTFSQLDELAKDIAPGSDGLITLPYLCGSTLPNANPNAQGVFFGLGLQHTRGHLVRSILESVAYLLKSNLECIEAEVNEIRALGGGASSALWCQIKSDIIKKNIITLKNNEAACLGSAILAGVGAGLFQTIEDACEQFIKKGQGYQPSGKDYEETYKRYKKLDDRLLNWEGGLWND